IPASSARPVRCWNAPTFWAFAPITIRRSSMRNGTVPLPHEEYAAFSRDRLRRIPENYENTRLGLVPDYKITGAYDETSRRGCACRSDITPCHLLGCRPS